MAARKRDRVFESRLERTREEMREIYLALYRDEGAFEYFCTVLGRCSRERDAALRRLDSRRERQPSWYRGEDLLGMLMYTQCYGETLNGVRERLDYLEETGVNYLHLMPLLESPKDRSDGGYAVMDYRRVQPELGTMEDLAALAAECHRRGMAVCLDFVMNHTSEGPRVGPAGPGRREGVSGPVFLLRRLVRAGSV